MIEIATQLRDKCPVCNTSFGNYFIPVYEEDQEATKTYKVFQILKSRFFGVEKPRSVEQMGTYWAACKFTADNLDHVGKFRYWNSKANVDFQLRVSLDFRDTSVVSVHPDGTVAFRYKSIAFPNLRHIMACQYFDRAFELMSHVLGMDVKEFINAVKSVMKSR